MQTFGKTSWNFYDNDMFRSIWLLSGKSQIKCGGETTESIFNNLSVLFLNPRGDRWAGFGPRDQCNKCCCIQKMCILSVSSSNTCSRIVVLCADILMCIFASNLDKEGSYARVKRRLYDNDVSSVVDEVIQAHMNNFIKIKWFLWKKSLKNAINDFI